MPKVLCLGDSTLDAILTLNEKEANLQCDLKQETCEICFDFSNKIPVEEVSLSLGGNAANVAVGLKRLGLEPKLYTIHGDDEVGGLINKRIKDEGLDSEGVVQEPGASSYSTIINFRGERTILEKKHPRRYEIGESFPKASWLYVSSLGPDYPEVFQKIAVWAKRNRVRLGYNPWRGELESGLETYSILLKNSLAVFVNKEEAALILGEKKIDAKEALGKISSLGPRFVALTDGKKGAYASDGEKFYFCKIFPAEAVEATGAGDAFASGFFGALVSDQNLSTAIKWGMVNSASVVAKVGAVAGLLYRKEIERRLAAAPKFGPVEI